MKFIQSSFCLAALLAAFSGGAYAEETPVVVLAPSGAVDTAMVLDVKHWCEQFLGVSVSVAPAYERSCDTIDAEIARLREAMLAGPGGLVIGLAAFPDEVRAHGVMRPDLGIAVVNVTALNRDRPENVSLNWRVQKETMRATGLLLGMETCPNPHCALHPYTTMSQLDRLGLNYCPPCMMKSRQLLDQRATALNPTGE